MSEEFIGAGWAFPLRTSPTGSIALVRRDQELREAVRLVIGTAYGERPMRPDFGCGIHDYVFSPSNASTAGRIAEEVRIALERWEPRIEVLDVDVDYDTEDSSLMYIDIRYTPAGTNDPRNLVFPFYTIPEEG